MNAEEFRNELVRVTCDRLETLRIEEAYSRYTQVMLELMAVAQQTGRRGIELVRRIGEEKP